MEKKNAEWMEELPHNKVKKAVWEEQLKKEGQVVSKPAMRWIQYKDNVMVLEMLTPAGNYVSVPTIPVDDYFRNRTS